MPWTVTRQHQWATGESVVEVSMGSIDYTNPDALVRKYPGEMQTYPDPREAARVAVEICRAWRRDGEHRAKVGHGATGGMTMPFEPCTFKELEAWAEKTYQKLPKCDRCGEVLPDSHWVHCDLPDERFCSEYCAEKAARVNSMAAVEA